MRWTRFTLVALAALAASGCNAPEAEPTPVDAASPSPSQLAQMHLAGLWMAESVYHKEHDTFAADLVALDWYPDGEPQYIFGFCGGPRAHSATDALRATGLYDDTRMPDLDDPCATLSALVPRLTFTATTETFQAFALGNLDDDPDLDLWTMDQRRLLLHRLVD